MILAVINRIEVFEADYIISNPESIWPYRSRYQVLGVINLGSRGTKYSFFTFSIVLVILIELKKNKIQNFTSRITRLNMASDFPDSMCIY